MNTSVSAANVSPQGKMLWRAALLALPLFGATVFFLLWRSQVDRFSHRAIQEYGSVPPFQLVNQNGEPFGSFNLAGKIWIADFIYSTCPGPCPMISSRMSEMQKPLAKTDVHLVSFSVDPQKDSPAVLRGYAEKLNAQAGRWDFLTGQKSVIYDLSRNGFRLAAGEHDGENGQPLHSTRMILVDRRGQIRGYYDATAPDAVTKLLADTSHLLKEQPR